jgi:hypothetical protein
MRKKKKEEETGRGRKREREREKIKIFEVAHRGLSLESGLPDSISMHAVLVPRSHSH